MSGKVKRALLLAMAVLSSVAAGQEYEAAHENDDGSYNIVLEDGTVVTDLPGVGRDDAIIAHVRLAGGAEIFTLGNAVTIFLLEGDRILVLDEILGIWSLRSPSRAIPSGYASVPMQR